MAELEIKPGTEPEQQQQQVEAPPAPDTPPPPPPTPPVEESAVIVADDVDAEEKAVVPAPALAEPVAAVLESKTLFGQALAEVPEPVEEKPLEGSINRDAILARVETEKRTSLIKAWEESEKSKAENKAHKRLSSVDAWENSKKATIEAELKKIEEKLEKKKAEYAEKMKNKIAIIHKEAEEKRAIVEAKRGEDILKAEEIAAKYRATGTTPKKLFKFF